MWFHIARYMFSLQRRKGKKNPADLSLAQIKAQHTAVWIEVCTFHERGLLAEDNGEMMK